MRKHAEQLDSYGFIVLPANHKTKSPRVSWKQLHATPLEQFSRKNKENYWVATGHLSRIYVLDIDSEAADRFWRDECKFGDAMDSTVRVKTRQGHHYYFRIDANDQAKGWALHEEDLHFDVRGSGGGVIAPPSVHESGFEYEWVQAPDPDLPDLGMVPAPDWMKSREATLAHCGRTGRSPQVTPNRPRSVLSELLDSPAGDGGRNVWLSKVAGHYARTYRNDRRAYELHVEIANAQLEPPMDRAEVAKTLESIWDSEVRNHPERDLDATTGWLASAGDHIVTQVRVGHGKDATTDLAPWADFDLRVRGVITDDHGDSLIYDCELIRQRGGSRDLLVPGETLGNMNKLQTFLARRGAAIGRPDDTFPHQPNDAVRLLRYLESQGAPRWRMTRALGWDADSMAFLTFDEAIRRDSVDSFDLVRPDPALRHNQVIDFNYGFKGGPERAREVLAEVCSFHDETTAAVFGGWWAAAFLKPQMMDRVSMFPIMAIESPSGSGKTNGYFNLMMQLNGSIQGPGLATMASTRDRIAAHQCGIVWLDDMETIHSHQELLRASTSNETMTKKAADYTSNVNHRLVAPVVLSGEFLGLSAQKALMDRTVVLHPSKPDGRRSRKPGREDRPQWDDIVELMAAHPSRAGQPGLTVYAGTLVQFALQLEDKVLDRLDRAKQQAREFDVDGRQGDKIAVVIAGAWLLDRMLNPKLADDEVAAHEQRVLDWATTAQARSYSAGEWDNRATQVLIPWALRDAQWPSSARGDQTAWIDEDGTVWVSVKRLAERWAAEPSHQVVPRTDSEQAIRAQLKRCHAPDDTRKMSKLFDIGRRNSPLRDQATYWALRDDVAQAVIARSRE